MSKKKDNEGAADGSVTESQATSSTPETKPDDAKSSPSEVEELRARVAELEGAKDAAERRAAEVERSLERIQREAHRSMRELGAKLREIGEAAEARASSKDEADTRSVVIELHPRFKSLTIAGIRLMKGAPVTIARSKLSQRQIAALTSDERVRVTERG